MRRDISFIQSALYPDFVLLMRAPDIVSVLSTFAPCEASQRVDIDVQDWDVMFCAVLERLRQSVGELPATPTMPPVPDSAGQVRAVVLECVDALSQLHAALKHDRACSTQPCRPALLVLPALHPMP
ncbi:MAG: hypothetical protein M3R45_02085 [Pseudomonadota bacterium]|nr:hypothetical protein [Pseudomonadota bacterium]